MKYDSNSIYGRWFGKNRETLIDLYQSFQADTGDKELMFDDFSRQMFGECVASEGQKRGIDY